MPSQKMPTPLLAAIDVGKSGGVAWNFCGATDCTKMPPSQSGVLELLRELRGCHRAEICDPACAPVVFIERVSGYIGQAHPASRMFNFGEGYGFLQGVLVADGWRVYLVTPQKWQGALDLRNTDKLSKPHWKRYLKDEAARSFPHLSPTLATADSLLILRYGMENFSEWK